MIVKSATITGITSEPVIVATKTFSNNSSKKATFDASISDQVTNTTESNWSETDADRSSADDFLWNRIWRFGSAGGSTSMSYNHSWGQGGVPRARVSVSEQLQESVLS